MQTNSLVERSAALAAPDSAISVLQFLRLCRDSGNPNRQLFTESAVVISWLGEILTEPERQRLIDFLSEYAAGRADLAKPRTARGL